MWDVNSDLAGSLVLVDGGSKSQSCSPYLSPEVGGRDLPTAGKTSVNLPTLMMMMDVGGSHLHRHRV